MELYCGKIPTGKFKVCDVPWALGLNPGGEQVSLVRVESASPGSAQ